MYDVASKDGNGLINVHPLDSKKLTCVTQATEIAKGSIKMGSEVPFW
jgi:hypothetical protein